MAWSEPREAYKAWRRAQHARDYYLKGRRNRYKANDKSCEIIGLVSATFSHITTDATPGSLTQTIFDTTSRADSAQILLNNATGSTKTIIAAWIRGKPVVRLSGAGRYTEPGDTLNLGFMGNRNIPVHMQGIIHDKYTDYEKQAIDGDITFETGNNFTVTVDQVNKLGDYYWKLNRKKKHIYTLSLVGFQSWFEPGEWYDLHIGSAGTAEYIDSVVECYDVRCSLSAGGAGHTSVAFREVEEDWKFDSNETARMIASGAFNRRPSQNYVTVAAQYYSGYADYYCDGTADQAEINDAITYLNQGGGGLVHLSKGTFYLTSTVTMLDDIVIEGEGAGTVLLENANNISCIYASSISNIEIRNIGFNVASGITNTVESTIHLFDVEVGTIINNIIRNSHGDAILCDQCEKNHVINNTIEYSGATSTAACHGIILLHAATSLGNIIQGNIITDVVTSNQATGILVQSPGYEFNCEIINNKIHDITGTASAYTAYGIEITGHNIIVNSNRIMGCKNTETATKAVGLYIATDSTNCQAINNYCYDNGADTGLANTNINNFLDGGTDTQWAG